VIVLIGSEKGGVGKSTLAAHAAVRLAMTGKPTFLVDADPQQTSWRWAMARKKYRPEAPVVESATFVGDLRPELEKLAKAYGHIVIDCGGADSMALRSAMVRANRMIIPSRVARRDIETLQHVSKLVSGANAERTKNGNTPMIARVVFNGIKALPSFWSRIEAAKNAVEGMGLGVSKYSVVDRVSYDDSQHQGGTVFDNDADPKASEEMERVLQSLLRKNQSE
jgi:chromosome partitioning protein